MNFNLETERLLLRELTFEDVEGMFEMNADPEVLRYVGNKPATTLAESRETIAFIRDQYEKYGIGRWAVIEKQTQAFMGWAGLKYITETFNGHTNFHDLGYRFIKKYWGKGYATETAQIAMDYGFNTLKLPKIYGMADINNLASRHVLEKVGLIYQGEFMRDGERLAWYERTNPAITSQFQNQT